MHIIFRWEDEDEMILKPHQTLFIHEVQFMATETQLARNGNLSGQTRRL